MCGGFSWRCLCWYMSTYSCKTPVVRQLVGLHTHTARARARDKTKQNNHKKQQTNTRRTHAMQHGHKRRCDKYDKHSGLAPAFIFQQDFLEPMARTLARLLARTDLAPNAKIGVRIDRQQHGSDVRLHKFGVASVSLAHTKLRCSTHKKTSPARNAAARPPPATRRLTHTRQQQPS